MIKIETALMAELIKETWELTGRTAAYPEEWKLGFITPIQKKGALNEPENDRPLCMLSSLRKIVEATIAEKISKRLHLFARQYGLKRGVLPTVTILGVDELVQGGKNRVATRDVSKTYDKVNRSILLKD